ncbi:hypothetical protein J3R82DRAFT_2251 [Butyriboletus roseoflavus]|nr:hypothetical protein J3R82DRAFT_2251 [Butyriboletus roseoflavus]
MRESGALVVIQDRYMMMYGPEWKHTLSRLVVLPEYPAYMSPRAGRARSRRTITTPMDVSGEEGGIEDRLKLECDTHHMTISMTSCLQTHMWLNCTVHRRIPTTPTRVPSPPILVHGTLATRQDYRPSTWQVLFIWMKQTVVLTGISIDQTYPQSRCDRKVRHSLRCLPAKAGEKGTFFSFAPTGCQSRTVADLASFVDGSDTTRSLHLHVLRQGKDLLSQLTKVFRPLYSTGLRQAYSSWHLALPRMQKDDRWGCLDRIDNCGCYSTEVSDVVIHDNISVLILT